MNIGSTSGSPSSSRSSTPNTGSSGTRRRTDAAGAPRQRSQFLSDFRPSPVLFEEEEIPSALSNRSNNSGDQSQMQMLQDIRDNQTAIMDRLESMEHNLRRLIRESYEGQTQELVDEIEATIGDPQFGDKWKVCTFVFVFVFEKTTTTDQHVNNQSTHRNRSRSSWISTSPRSTILMTRRSRNCWQRRSNAQKKRQPNNFRNLMTK